MTLKDLKARLAPGTTVYCVRNMHGPVEWSRQPRTVERHTSRECVFMTKDGVRSYLVWPPTRQIVKIHNGVDLVSLMDASRVLVTYTWTREGVGS